MPVALGSETFHAGHAGACPVKAGSGTAGTSAGRAQAELHQIAFEDIVGGLIFLLWISPAEALSSGGFLRRFRRESARTIKQSLDPSARVSAQAGQAHLLDHLGDAGYGFRRSAQRYGTSP